MEIKLLDLYSEILTNETFSNPEGTNVAGLCALFKVLEKSDLMQPKVCYWEQKMFL